ncbi:MAG: HAMP domain-containing sensor histidine kinase [Clostridium sp.]|uniref:sensor histidine kinase n=1 Tax=Clostridium sp. TaxID=1506 RepID=UPI0039E978BF
MLKIRNRIALLYSLLTIALIIICVILFYCFLKINIDRQPILSSIISNKSYNVSIPKEKGAKANDANNKITIALKDNSINNSIGKDLYSKNSLLMILDKDNNVLYSEHLPNNFDENLINKAYGAKGIESNFKNMNENDIINNHNKNNILIILDENNKVIRYQILPDDFRLYNGENSSKVINLTWENFQNIFMNILYQRIILVILIVIAIILVINFILSRQYASFALRPLIEFTGKVKRQKNFETIELIEPTKTKDEIYDLTVAYNEALSKVKLSYENLQRLNSYVSHELRNSLAVLRAKIEIGEDTKEITQYIDSLNGVITDILAMSTSSLSNNEETVDLALVCAKIVDEYTVIFNNIKFNMPEDGVEAIKGKEIWIERCIVNLIDNAMKFVDKNKTNNEINIQVSEDDTNIIVEVYDNGIGIDASKFHEIFTPYYGTKRRTSTGIGLAYVKHVMDLHKGKVLVESKKGEYSKFSLVFFK